MEKVPITRTGYDALNAELKAKKDIERPEIIKAIAEAREHGDLSENAEYHSAKERQGFIEGRIKELVSIISRADVIEPSKMSGATIRFGATVGLADEDSGEERIYQIVGEPEADINAGRLNIRSPLARALIGKEEGDSVEVAAPGGARSYEGMTVIYLGAGLPRRSCSQPYARLPLSEDFKRAAPAAIVSPGGANGRNALLLGLSPGGVCLGPRCHQRSGGLLPHRFTLA